MLDYPVGHTTVVIPIHTTAADGSPVNGSSAFEVGDFVLYKDGGTTQRSSTAGWTIRSPFDSVDGLHALILDLSDNTDAGFYAAGHTYQVAFTPDETVDGIAVTRWVGQFSIDLHGIAAALSTLNGKLDAIDDYVDTEVAAIKTVTDRLDAMIEDSSGYRYKAHALEEAPTGGGGGGDDFTTWRQGEDLDGFAVFMRSAANPGLGAEGLSVTAEVWDGSDWIACENTPVEMSHGWYAIDLTAADSTAHSGVRVVKLRFSAATALDTNRELILQPAAA